MNHSVSHDLKMGKNEKYKYMIQDQLSVNSALFPFITTETNTHGFYLS
jgi:hypothetical protein